MKTYVAWVSYKKETPNRGYWDMQMLEDIFNRQMWTPVRANEFEHVNSIRDVPRNADGCIIILPARSHAHEMWTDKLNDEMARFKWVIFMAVGDEESVFPAWRLRHRNMKLWLMMPRDQWDMHKRVDVGLPNGYPTDMRKFAGKFFQEEMTRPIDWFFSGQDTHRRRHDLVEVGQSIHGVADPNATSGAVLIRTDGFTKGLPHEDYYRLMASAKVIPCPSGASAPDSFRVYEAIESGCVPVADNRSPDDFYPAGYWKFLLKEQPPFPVVDGWHQFPNLVYDLLKEWPAPANRIGSWWIQYKRRLVYQLEDHVNLLRGESPVPNSLKDKITVLISSSPIPSHPSAAIIRETIASIRSHLPESEIIIMQDGIRAEQSEMRAAYDRYKQEILFACRNEYHNVLPFFFDEFLHQAEMTRRTLDQVKTPHILFVEHDTPLCEDKTIEWDGIIRVIESGWAQSVRLHHMDCEFIHPEHMSLAIDKCRQDVCGIQCVRTRQYSQRPHVASVDFYRQMLSTLSDKNRTFIEDRVYDLFAGERAALWTLAVYTPEGHIKRSRDLNGRAGGPKFDDRLVF